MPYRDDLDALEARDAALSREIRVASPCSADWNAMVGDDRVRYCATCSKSVYNLSSMTRAEAAALIIEREGKLCVRFYQRKDGTLLLQDCSVGVWRRRHRTITALAIAAGAAATTYGALHDAPPAVPAYIETVMGEYARTDDASAVLGFVKPEPQDDGDR